MPLTMVLPHDQSPCVLTVSPESFNMRITEGHTHHHSEGISDSDTSQCLGQEPGDTFQRSWRANHELPEIADSHTEIGL